MKLEHATARRYTHCVMSNPEETRSQERLGGVNRACLGQEG